MPTLTVHNLVACSNCDKNIDRRDAKFLQWKLYVHNGQSEYFCSGFCMHSYLIAT